MQLDNNFSFQISDTSDQNEMLASCDQIITPLAVCGNIHIDISFFHVVLLKSSFFLARPG